MEISRTVAFPNLYSINSMSGFRRDVLPNFRAGRVLDYPFLIFLVDSVSPVSIILNPGSSPVSGLACLLHQICCFESMMGLIVDISESA